MVKYVNMYSKHLISATVEPALKVTEFGICFVACLKTRNIRTPQNTMENQTSRLELSEYTVDLTTCGPNRILNCLALVW